MKSLIKKIHVYEIANDKAQIKYLTTTKKIIRITDRQLDDLIKYIKYQIRSAEIFYTNGA